MSCTGIRTPSVFPRPANAQVLGDSEAVLFLFFDQISFLVSVLKYNGKNTLKMNRVWGARSLRVWSTVTGESKLQEIKQQATGHIIYAENRPSALQNCAA